MTRHLARITVLSLLMVVAVPLYLAAQPGQAQSEGPRGPVSSGASGGAGERGGSGGGSSAPAGIGDTGGSSSGGGGSVSAPSPTPWMGRDSGGERGPRRFEDNQPAHQGPPPYSRPRGEHPATGQAIPRSEAPPPPSRTSAVVPGYYGYYNGYYDNYFNRYYNPFGYGAFGLGYFYYDPMWWSYPSGYWYGYPSSAGYGYDQGAVRLKIKPEDAEVYLDGYYVGRVDDFDGVFQRLRLDYGPHRVEIRARGFESLVFEVRTQPGRTITYRGELKPAP